LTGENRRTRRKSCPSATLPTINPTWIDPGANPGLRGERPSTNHLSHGTAHCRRYSYRQFIFKLFFWVMTPCRLVSRYQSLGEICCLRKNIVVLTAARTSNLNFFSFSVPLEYTHGMRVLQFVTLHMRISIAIRSD
jgi:hypothetical protein